MIDLISRQAAIDALREAENHAFNGLYKGLVKAHKIVADLPSVQPEHLTDDDFETIRIHLSAHKEELCNQCRWEKAEEYQRIIDRFMNFVSAQPEIIRCKDCKWFYEDRGCIRYLKPFLPDDFCSRAERREDE